MKYLVAIKLPEEISKKISAIQQAYKSSAWEILIEPHITLLPPSLALVSLDDAEKILAGIAQNFKPFELEVVGLSRFRNKSNTVFATLGDSEPLQRLHGALLQVAPTFTALDMHAYRQREFIPHITLSNKLYDVLADQILTQLAAEDLNFNFECSGFTLFKKDLDDKFWQPVLDFAIK